MYCCCLPCNHRSNRTWVVEPAGIIAYLYIFIYTSLFLSLSLCLFFCLSVTSPSLSPYLCLFMYVCLSLSVSHFLSFSVSLLFSLTFSLFFSVSHSLSVLMMAAWRIFGAVCVLQNMIYSPTYQTHLFWSRIQKITPTPKISNLAIYFSESEVLLYFVCIYTSVHSVFQFLKL